jgi:hypothetical protein
VLTSLAPKWGIRLTGKPASEVCSAEKAYSPECFAAMDKLGKIASEVAHDADEMGYRYAGVKKAAEDIELLAQKWNGTCITSKPSTPERADCVFKVLLKVGRAEESILVAIYDVEPP